MYLKKLNAECQHEFFLRATCSCASTKWTNDYQEAGWAFKYMGMGCIVLSYVFSVGFYLYLIVAYKIKRFKGQI